MLQLLLGDIAVPSAPQSQDVVLVVILGAEGRQDGLTFLLLPAKEPLFSASQILCSGP